MGDQVADALIAKLVPQIKALKIGAGTSCGLDMGPLVTAPGAVTRSRATSMTALLRAPSWWSMAVA